MRSYILGCGKQVFKVYKLGNRIPTVHYNGIGQESCTKIVISREDKQILNNLIKHS